METGYVNVPVQALGPTDMTSFKVIGRLAIQAGRVSSNNPPQTFLNAYSTLAQHTVSIADISPVLSGLSVELGKLNAVLLKPILQDIVNGARLADLQRRMAEQSA